MAAPAEALEELLHGEHRLPVAHALPVAASLLEHLGELGDDARGAAREELRELDLALVAEEELRARAHQGRLADASVARLRGEVDLEDALDLVAEEVEPHRERAARREDVHHAAAHGEFAGVLDRLGARVACVREPLGELARRAPLAGAHRAQEPRQERGTGHELHGRRHRRDHDRRRAALREPPHQRQALGEQVERGAALARHGLERGEERGLRAEPGGREPGELGDRLVGLVEVRGQEEHAAPRAARERGGHERGAAPGRPAARGRPARLDVGDEGVERSVLEQPAEDGGRCDLVGHQRAA